MKQAHYRRLETDPLDDLRVLLQGRVFHVSALQSLPQILADGLIHNNKDRSRPTPFGYLENGFFRNRGCVSVFDYRAEPSDLIAERRGRCSPFQVAEPGLGGIAIFLLAPEALDVLIPWTRWQDEEASSEMVVPYVEAGYPAAIPLSLVTEIVTLELIEDPECLMARHRKAQASRWAHQRR